MRILAACASLCLLASFGAYAQDRSTPEATVRTFLAAFERGDLRQAATCVKGVRMTPAQLDFFSQEVKKDPVSFALTNATTTLNGASATVAGKVAVKNPRQSGSESFATQTSLESSGGTWMILANPAKAQADKGTDVVNGLAYMLTEPKVMTMAKSSAEAVACLSNVKQLCTGVLMLNEDNGEVLKLSPATFKKSVMPYVKNASLFSCPVGGAASYSFNANLAGVRQTNIRSVAETVMIYEGKNGKLDFRHDGKAAVGFADGHAKLVNATGAQKLRWKP
jgi:prepilin-type processing-associated H-X9-DG protein